MSVEILQIELLALPGKACSRQKFEKNFTPVDERPDFPGFLKRKKSPPSRIVKVGLGGSSGFSYLLVCKVKAVEIHHLVPCGGEVVDEFFPGIGAGVGFGNRSELGV